MLSDYLIVSVKGKFGICFPAFGAPIPLGDVNLPIADSTLSVSCQEGISVFFFKF